MRTFCIRLAAVLMLAHPAVADRWVSTAGNDAAAGTQVAPYRTITKALSVATAGETIHVAAGTYDAAGGEAFPLVVDEAVILLGDAGASATIVDAGLAARVMLVPAAGSGARIEGFTIRNGRHVAVSVTDGGGGIRIDSAGDVILARNVIESNIIDGAPGTANTSGVSACGGGVYSAGSTFSIENNVFRSNMARGGPGGMNVEIFIGTPAGGGSGGAICAVAPLTNGALGHGILHNTFYGNLAAGGNSADFIMPGGSAQGGAIYAELGTTVRNNVIANNTATGGGIFPIQGAANAGGLTGGAASDRNLYHTNAPNHGTTSGTDLVDVDPQFLSPGSDFDVAFGSPVTGAGFYVGIDEDFDGFRRRTTPSIGAFEPPLPPEADYNADGKNDLIWRQPSTGKNVLWRMNGATRLSYTSLLDVIGSSWSLGGSGQLNPSSDAHPDLLWRNGSTGQNVAWGMNGSVRTSLGYLLSVPAPWVVGGLGDFDADGDADIVWRNPATGQNVLWLMNGIVRSSYTSLLTVPGAAWLIAGVGDLDGDGRPDLVWRNGSSGQNVIWFMDGAARRSYASTIAVPEAAWRIQAVEDMNGDEKADLVWRNVSSGQNVIWFMSGASRTSYAATLPVADPSWEIQSPK